MVILPTHQPHAHVYFTFAHSCFVISLLQVTENMMVPGLSENSVLLVRAAELLGGGGVSDALFESMVMVASLPSKLIE